MKLRKCSFCGKDIPIGRGVMFVKNDGTIFNFCSNKCKKAQLVHKKNPRKTRWTVHYGKE
ncbi:MAG: 50S ribosomal protein L24e [Promethearchaeia archaeon]